MEYTNIQGIEKKNSRIGLGTWAIGGSLWGGTEEEKSIKTIHQAFDKGITFIDTAPAYGKGESEKIVGKALKSYGNRDSIVIATKVGLNQESPDKVFRDLKRSSILKEMEDSLQRLQVDCIDLYQVHWPDPTVSLKEPAETLKQILEEGKIKAIGVSNFTVDQIIEFKKYAPIHTCQPPFNIYEREAEKGVVTYCKKEGIVLIGYGSLCRGLLSGKMSKNREFKGDDLRKGMDPKFKEPHFSDYLKCSEELKIWVERKYKKPLIALAVRWALDKGINIALWGARSSEQLVDMESVFGWKLSEEDFKEIETILSKNIKHPVGPDFMSPPLRGD